MRNEKNLLLAGVLVPFLYVAVLYAAGGLYPNYSHIVQIPSDLGADGAPYQWIGAFNIGLILVGVFGILSGVELFRGLLKLGRGKTLAVLTSLTVISVSVNMILSGVFPLPSPYHSLLELLLPSVFVSLFGAIALRKPSNSPMPAIIMFVAFIMNFILFGIMLGIGDIANEDNVGLWIRLWAAVLLPSIGYLCWVVRRRLGYLK